MYETYWGLKEQPFDNSPNPKFFYLSPEHEEALVRLMYAVRQRKGCALLTGEYGCGKTTLSRALIQRVEAERYEIGLLTNPRWTPTDFLREVLYQLGIESQGTTKTDLLHQLNDVFFRNFQTDDRFLVTLLLIGSPELAAKVRRLKHLDQRIAIRYHLNTLDDAHSAAYIAHRLQMAGQSRPIFTEAAVKLIFDFTRGTPREINNICDIALLVGYSKKATAIDERIIAEVIKDKVGAG